MTVKATVFATIVRENTALDKTVQYSAQAFCNDCGWRSLEWVGGRPGQAEAGVADEASQHIMDMDADNSEHTVRVQKNQVQLVCWVMGGDNDHFY